MRLRAQQCTLASVSVDVGSEPPPFTGQVSALTIVGNNLNVRAYVPSTSLDVIVTNDACRNSGNGESCRGAAVRVVSAPWTGFYGRTPGFGGNREDGRRGMEGHRGVCDVLLVVPTCWTAAGVCVCSGDHGSGV